MDRWEMSSRPVEKASQVDRINHNNCDIVDLFVAFALLALIELAIGCV
jgi:hypothetical protein